MVHNWRNVSTVKVYYWWRRSANGEPLHLLQWQVDDVLLERQIFFSGTAKQNKVGAKERQVFSSGKAKQNKVGENKRLSCLAFAPTLKRNNRVTLFLQLHFFRFTDKENVSLFCSNFILFPFTAEQNLSFFCSNRFYVSLFYDNSNLTYKLQHSWTELDELGSSLRSQSENDGSTKTTFWNELYGKPRMNVSIFATRR